MKGKFIHSLTQRSGKEENIARMANTVQCHFKLSAHNGCQEFRFSTVLNTNNFTQVHKPCHVMAFVLSLSLSLVISCPGPV